MAELEDTLRRFREQFQWNPILENPSKLGVFRNFVVTGMGGSHLGAWLIQKYAAKEGLDIHRDYGLPPIAEANMRNTLFIASSYSGNTEETLDSAQRAFEKGIHVAAVSTGGKLLDFAREHSLPFITIPDTSLEPRMAIGFATVALARIMNDGILEAAIRKGGKDADPLRTQAQGAMIAQKIFGKIPIVWASEANAPLSYIWKIKFNETTKIPAFSNVLPELCHNEFTGFDVADSTRGLSTSMHVLILEDNKDHPRIQKRIQIARDMLTERKIGVDTISITGEGFEKAFNAALLGDWVSLELARMYHGTPNAATPIIAEFKKRMAQ